ncbi:hypothetical protein ERJ75_001039400 [Trypanosoma vivax]|nr:hypothetical protein ERJ75_001039400 [Trypanosoma vivax]
MAETVMFDDSPVEMDGPHTHVLYRDEVTGMYRVALVIPPTEQPQAVLPQGNSVAESVEEEAIEFFND